MKLSFKFSNLLGNVYQKGNVLFTRDDVLISLVGNKISLFHLRDNRTHTLQVESMHNLTTVALAPNGCYFIAATETGQALMCSLVSNTVLHTHHFRRPIRAIAFSPDGKYFAVTRENQVLVHRAPGRAVREFDPFTVVRVITVTYDDTICLDWTSGSQVLAIGCKDMSTRVCSMRRFQNFDIYSFSGHSDSIVGCFFEQDSLDLYTLSKNGELCIWESSIDLQDLLLQDASKSFRVAQNDNRSFFEEEGQAEQPQSERSVEKLTYRCASKHFLKRAIKAEGYITLSASAYHRGIHLLVTGFSAGVFLLHEMPDVNLIHSLQLGHGPITTVAINHGGDWIAVANSSEGQLIVWEWQSESFIFKQQGHLNDLHVLSYSPDGLYIVTGGDDGKVKVWNTASGVCFVTFVEHKSGITGVTFVQSGKAVVSSSLDGTVRAFDMCRYRNFRTFTAPRPTQFLSLAVDPNGEIVCASAQDTFEIFVWSMQTGRLLEILAGHEAPVSSLSFSPREAVLLSASWDKTVRLWDVFEHKGNREAITFVSDALDVQFRPDGQEFAVATLDGNISFFDVHSSVQLGSIEGRHDLGSGRRDADKVTAKKLLSTQAFTTLCYSADGDFILAAGRSKYVCIYHVSEKLLMKKFEVTCNRSLDGITDVITRRKMAEFGSKSLIMQREEGETTADIRLPGVKSTDMAARAFKPEVSVSCIRFSPGGRSWAATTVEGLLIYSLDQCLVFDPFQLSEDITPMSVRNALRVGDFGTALMMAVRLNELQLTTEVIESIPVECIELVCRGLHVIYAEKLLAALGTCIEKSRHLEFYVTWIWQVLVVHGPNLKQQSHRILPLLNTIQKNLLHKYTAVEKMCDYNVYMLKYVLNMAQLKKRKCLENDMANNKVVASDDSESS